MCAALGVCTISAYGQQSCDAQEVSPNIHQNLSKLGRSLELQRILRSQN